MGCELGEAMRPLFNEWLIVKLLVDNDVQKAQRQRIIRSRTQLQPDVGAPRKLGRARIDDYYFWIRIERLAHVEAGLAIRTGIQRVVTPKKHTCRRCPPGEIRNRKVAKREN